MGWTSLLSFLFFYLMKKLNLLRVSEMEELIGLDYAEMGSLNRAFILKVRRIKAAAEFFRKQRDIR